MQGADVNAYETDPERAIIGDKRTVLLVAIYDCRQNNNQQMLVKMLLKAGANPNERSSFSLHSALLYTVWYAGEETTKLLLAQPQLNPNLENRVGWTALSVAMTNGRESQMIAILQDPRTRLNRVGKGWLKGQTPLGKAYCAGGSSTRIASNIALLKKYGATRCTGCSKCP